MFYFLLAPVLSYNFILIAAAVIPAIFLMIKAYNSDRLEKEDTHLLWTLVKAGVLSSLLALLEERVLALFLKSLVQEDSVLYYIILYFGVVAFAEESSKYIFLKKNTWRNPEFNCRYDGVVYAVFVSLGFALWENISYVMTYGFGTAIVRAVTAIPGHACFGVFMGVFYGVAKKSENRGEYGVSKFLRVCSVIVPALLHGAYDYVATMSYTNGSLYFIVFIVILFFVSFRLVGKASDMDEYI